MRPLQKQQNVSASYLDSRRDRAKKMARSKPSRLSAGMTT
jgi:hypothetical protein